MRLQDWLRLLEQAPGQLDPAAGMLLFCVLTALLAAGVVATIALSVIVGRKVRARLGL